jgi:hypothetical protein
MIKTFCDRCRKETTGEPHGAINGIVDANDNGDGTNQVPDCFDIVCEACFAAWRAWMKPCTNCGHVDAHDGPAGDVADACPHPGCNCGFDSRGDTSRRKDLEAL